MTVLQKCDSKSIQLQLRWDKGDLISFYQFTGYLLTPLLAEVEKMLLLCSDCSHLASCKTDLCLLIACLMILYKFCLTELMLMCRRIIETFSNSGGTKN